MKLSKKRRNYLNNFTKKNKKKTTNFKTVCNL